jgi:hypothetical protein
VPPLYDRVLAYIDDASADEFETLALAVFAHQFASCAPYRRFCRSRGVSPDNVADWQGIPAVPIVAFKHADLACGPAVRTFLSSGSTEGPETRSRHMVPDLRLYRRSAVAGLRRFLFPDIARMHLVSLIPPVSELPESSLAQMIEWTFDAFGTPESVYAANASGIDIATFVAALQAAERAGWPVCVLTTTGALIRVLDICRARGLAVRLPHGSRLMDTGGDKGAPRPLSRNGVLHAVWSAFAIPGYFCVNEYGMAELSSQYYDSVIADRVAGHHVPRRKLAPHWARVRVLDPDTLAPVAGDASGLLCHVDLANAGTAMAILSEDIGRAVDDGFELLGRAPRADLRGCSLTTSAWDAA